MIRRTLFTLSAVTALTLLSASTAQAQTATDSQTFTVTVPAVVSVTAPADQTLTHDGNDADQSFLPQLWQVRCNSGAGGSFVVTTQSAFTNGGFKRDAKLDLLKIGGSPNNDWTVGTASATTDYAAAVPVEQVSVNAASTRPGSADFNLTVTLVDNSFDDLAAGDYVMTVDGTVTAN